MKIFKYKLSVHTENRFSILPTMSSIALTLSGTSSELTAEYHPPIELDKNGEYVCGLVDFQSYMTVANINQTNNKVYFDRKFEVLIKQGIYSLIDIQRALLGQLSNKDYPMLEKFEKKFVKSVTGAGTITKEVASKYNLPELYKMTAGEFKSKGLVSLNEKLAYLRAMSASSKARYEQSGVIYYSVFEDVMCSLEIRDMIELPVGSYEIEDIEKKVNEMIKKELQEESFKFNIFVNKITSKCEVQSTHELYFNGADTFASVLGFIYEREILPNQRYLSDSIIKISRVNVVKIECNIVEGAYSNNNPVHTLHEFYPIVEVGYKIVEVPTNVIYLPLTVRSIRNISMRIVDQENNLIDFRGETITLRIHIKKI